jgi:hypothetical protein
MQTTNLVVEQMIIGILTVLAGALLISCKLVVSLFEIDLGAAVILLAVVYLAGIIFDKLADTLLQDVEQALVLCKAFQRTEGKPPLSDPFPIEILRIWMLDKSGQGLTDHADYVRSRIRLSRALMVVTPALTAGAASAVIEASGGSTFLRIGLAGIVVFFYTLAFLMKATDTQWLNGKKLPKTQNLVEEPVYIKNKEKYYVDPRKASFPQGTLRYILQNEPLSWLLLLYAFCLSSILLEGGWWELISLPIIGFGLTLFFGWTWMRINKTQLALLDDFEKYQKSIIKIIQ